MASRRRPAALRSRQLGKFEGAPARLAAVAVLRFRRPILLSGLPIATLNPYGATVLIPF